MKKKAKMKLDGSDVIVGVEHPARHSPEEQLEVLSFAYNALQNGFGMSLGMTEKQIQEIVRNPAAAAKYPPGQEECGCLKPAFVPISLELVVTMGHLGEMFMLLRSGALSDVVISTHQDGVEDGSVGLEISGTITNVFDPTDQARVVCISGNPQNGIRQFLAGIKQRCVEWYEKHEGQKAQKELESRKGIKYDA